MSDFETGDFKVAHNVDPGGRKRYNVWIGNLWDNSFYVANGETKAAGIAEMERFIADAQLALAELRKLPEDTE